MRYVLPTSNRTTFFPAPFAQECSFLPGIKLTLSLPSVVSCLLLSFIWLLHLTLPLQLSAIARTLNYRCSATARRALLILPSTLSTSFRMTSPSTIAPKFLSTNNELGVVAVGFSGGQVTFPLPSPPPPKSSLTPHPSANPASTPPPQPSYRPASSPNLKKT